MKGDNRESIMHEIESEKKLEGSDYDKCDISVSEMLKMSIKLWEKHKDSWAPMEPAYGKSFILYMIEEIGEVIAIIKKKGESEIMENPTVRDRFLEELSDVLMYYSDTLNRFKITPEEIASAYVKKFNTNMKRDYEKQYEKYIDGK